MKRHIKSVIYWLLSPFLIRKHSGPDIYLTYDDGPHPQITPEILTALAESNTQATFFMLGNAMEKYPEIVNQAIAAGHTIGYHSFNHKSFKDRQFSEIREDLKTMKTISKRFNYPLSYYRPPFGDLTLIGLLWLILKGKKIIMWSLDSRDSFDELTQVKNNIATQQVAPGDILLFHDDYLHAADLIRNALVDYQQNNIRCKPL